MNYRFLWVLAGALIGCIIARMFFLSTLQEISFDLFIKGHFGLHGSVIRKMLLAAAVGGTLGWMFSPGSRTS